jgi:hypothetical protein
LFEAGASYLSTRASYLSTRASYLSIHIDAEDATCCIEHGNDEVKEGA